MRFFSKIAVIFNLCFLVEAFFYYNKYYITNGNVPKPLDFARGSVVVLGEIAWIVNILFLLIVFIRASFKMKGNISKVIIIFNILVFVFQVYFYFIDRS